ncbi:hypothetical protein [Microcoleus sp.]|uniref:hypothetical protein n=1 Tax=Microcoleus sp. TaxID=44472 RepID=UPI00403EB71E
MSFADEMRRKSLEAQSNAAEKARREALEALVLKRALEESKRNNCIPDLKKEIQEAASRGLREVIIKHFPHAGGLFPLAIENLEWNSFWEMYSSDLDEYDRMRIAFIQSEPGLSLTWGVKSMYTIRGAYDDGGEFETFVVLKVVW